MSKKGESNKRARVVGAGAGAGAEAGDDTEVVVDDFNPPLTMPQIQTRIRQLLSRLPGKDATAALAADEIPAMENWCHTVRGILRNYNLTLNFVAIANYQWEPDRPGHTGQSLGALRNQISLSTAQTNIVSNHIGRVLTPTLDRQLMKKRTVELENGEKEESYVYKNVVNDPEMLQLNREQLCNEAIYKRQLLVSTMEQMCQCMDDYQKAEAGAAGGDGQRFSMAY
mmetsp:Transcript_18881/g.34023  ORF Transcript_18881/g.34023 Transcript_18881/m.34023 type:complete len:226 (+) Transcript_18881:175-852(+)|eukprot:CAMPEP_0201604572 /NCGR_PEP_ID=MMETSP0492-20130828/4670_1 /ASSEMBLY_ACC=CAM_ASM_000837 /TAXON_ID=420259 /ORGANISM="Thalassiosira gravida, Strain GMp14c1" /LENGTH=225 /DNA_ID=CAMNT_0048068635 /DNA_START=46 /DNA_END=723 /DNA_ORIENTATION=-